MNICFAGGGMCVRVWKCRWRNLFCENEGQIWSEWRNMWFSWRSMMILTWEKFCCCFWKWYKFVYLYFAIIKDLCWYKCIFNYQHVQVCYAKIIDFLLWMNYIFVFWSKQNKYNKLVRKVNYFINITKDKLIN